MTNKNILAVLSVLSIVALVVAQFFVQKQSLIDAESVFINCRPDKEVCSFQFKTVSASIRIDEVISPLKPFTIILTDHTGAIQSADIQLSMKSMDMGFNKFSFKPSAEKLWITKAVLPVCTAGRSDWVFEITLDTGIEKVSVNFEVAI